MDTPTVPVRPGVGPRFLRVALRTVLGLPEPVKRVLAGPCTPLDGQCLDLDFQLLRTLTGTRRGRFVPEPDVHVVRARQAYFSSVVAGPPVPGVRRRPTTVPGAAGELPARLYVPDGAPERGPLALYFHGGGFVSGGLDSHDGLCAALCAGAGVRVLSVDYRLAPEHPFPAGVDDCLAAFRHVVDHPGSFETLPGTVAVAGDSAGGSLALTVGWETTRSTEPAPAFVLAFFPVVDLVGRTRSRTVFGEGFFLTSRIIDAMADWYVPAERRADPRLAVGSADLAGMPPTYLATAGFDPLRDEGEALVARMRAAGVDATLCRHPDLTHGFTTTLGVGPRPRQAVAEAACALRRGLGATVGTALPAPCGPLTGPGPAPLLAAV